MILPLLLACAPFEGTWVFYVDPSVTTTGDCADEGDGDDVTYESNQGTLVDIYALTSGGYAVMLGQTLTGVASGNSLEAEWVEVVDDGDTSRSTYQRLVATLESGGLLGVYASGTWRESSSGSDYTCESSYDFTAERVVSDDARFVGGGE